MHHVIVESGLSGVLTNLWQDVLYFIFVTWTNDVVWQIVKAVTRRLVEYGCVSKSMLKLLLKHAMCNYEVIWEMA